ncbi:hypothetical protein VVD49_16445 [Uliginosibacterium sp. H3]|uniref:Uncharacterized protein n=1 Tax=Uliginosibacterium silvisoli TaxID=3114758 RepID=A0ABU6K6V6_9RHOO|nr:hypothetical protein [Uliginosibacterium sp. H3]
MNRMSLLRAVLACSLAAGVAAANSMEYVAKGNVLTLSGMVTGDDVLKLKTALVPEIKFVILKGPTGSDFQDALYAAHAVHDAKVTTVVQGVCGYACARMFLAGTQRMFSGDVSVERSVVELSARAQYFDFSKTSDDSKNLKSVVDFPFSVWLKYAFPNTGAGSFSVGAILVMHPDVKKNASVLGCLPEARKREDCAPLPELSALETKVITTTELFRVPRGVAPE